MQSLLVFAIFLFGASAVNSQRTNCSDTGTFYTEDRLFTFTYTRNGGDVEITATAVTDNWVAIGISENMIMVSELYIVVYSLPNLPRLSILARN